jgi:hypothetical protein
MTRIAATSLLMIAVLFGCGQTPAPVAKHPPKKEEPVRTAAEVPKPVEPVKAADVPKPVPMKDDFGVGSKFKGKRTMTKVADQPISLVVTKRDGADFEGQLTVGGGKLQPLVINVTGKAGLANGTVAFSTDKAGQFQQSFTGDYKDGKLAFECRGKTRNNQDATGKGVLERQK